VLAIAAEALETRGARATASLCKIESDNLKPPMQAANGKSLVDEEWGKMTDGSVLGARPL
jgi:hypothetical protein